MRIERALVNLGFAGKPHQAPPRAGASLSARDALQTSRVVAVGDLEVDLEDKDGLASPSEDDLKGKIKGQVAVDSSFILDRLKTAIKSDSQKTVKAIAFDPRTRTYVIEGRARFGRFPGPTFKITLKADEKGCLVIHAASWADWIAGLLGRPTTAGIVEKALRDQKAPFSLSRQGKTITLSGIKDMTLPLGTEHATLTIADYRPQSTNGPFAIAPDGRILIDLAGAIKGFVQRGKPTRPTDHPDRAHLVVHFVAHEDKSIRTHVTGEGAVAVSEDQLADLIGQRREVLAPLMRSGRMQVSDLVVDGLIHPDKSMESEVSGKAHFETPEGFTIDTPFTATMSSKNQVIDVHSDTIKVKDRFNGEQIIKGGDYHGGPDGTRLNFAQAPDPKIQTPYEGNRLGLWVGGEAYYHHLLEAVGMAKRGIMMESFGFPGGPKPEALMQALLERAGGLAIGKLGPDPVQVRLLVDPGPYGTENWADRVAQTLRGKARDPWTLKYLAEVRAGKGAWSSISAAQRAQFLEQATAHFEVRNHPGGLARTDHRKVVVIDGLLGITGGINVGQDHFSRVQDVMVPIIGPAVRHIAEAFSKTWDEDGEPLSAADQAIFMQGDEAIKTAGVARFGAFVDSADATARVLTTDDKSHDIELAYLEAIDGAKGLIQLEQQYMTEGRIVEALERAVKRGVTVRAIVPEDQENEFDLGNSLSYLRLLEASKPPGAGKIDLRYYRTGGTWSYHVHSKVLTVDGKRALIGSANVDQRAMRGLAWTGNGRLLWNKELNLDIVGADLVGKVDADLFDKDAAATESRSIWQKMAVIRIEAGMRPHNRGLQRFLEDKTPQVEMRNLAHELQGSYRKELANLQATPSKADNDLAKAAAATEANWETQWAATEAMIDRLKGAAARYKSDSAGAGASLEDLQMELIARITMALPKGRDRELEIARAQEPFEALIRQLDLAPADGAPWFANRLAGAWSLATAHVLLAPVEAAIGAAYEAGGVDKWGELARKTFRPDENKARLSDAFNILF